MTPFLAYSHAGSWAIHQALGAVIREPVYRVMRALPLPVAIGVAVLVVGMMAVAGRRSR